MRSDIANHTTSGSISKIPLHKVMSHTDDQSPRSFYVTIAKFRGEVTTCFPYDLQSTHHPRLRPFIGVERLTAGLILLDASNGIQNIQQAGAIASHAWSCLDWDGFAQHLLTNSRTQAALRHDIDATSQEVLEIHEQAANIEDTASRRHTHEQVDIARLVGVASRDRAEDPDVRRSVVCGQLEHVRPVALQSIAGSHREWRRGTGMIVRASSSPNRATPAFGRQTALATARTSETSRLALPHAVP